MEFIILRKHGDFFIKFRQKILSFKIFFILIQIVELLELNIGGGYMLVDDCINIPGVVEIL